jgi:hypothetical protein
VIDALIKAVKAGELDEPNGLSPAQTSISSVSALSEPQNRFR